MMEPEWLVERIVELKVDHLHDKRFKMKKTDRYHVFVLMALFLTCSSIPVAGQEENGFQIPLEGRHGISLYLGILNHVSVERDVSLTGVDSETRVNGFFGSISYSYWVSRQWAIDIAVGVVDAKTSTSTGIEGVKSESAGIVPVLFGVDCYPSFFALGSSVRLFGSAALGPYIGFATKKDVGSNIELESTAESVLGAYFRLGADAFIGRNFRISLAAGYHLVDEFSETIGRGEDFSGPEFLFGFGVLFGKGR
jgi:hypothetical protein